MSLEIDEYFHAKLRTDDAFRCPPHIKEQLKLEAGDTIYFRITKIMKNKKNEVKSV